MITVRNITNILAGSLCSKGLRVQDLQYWNERPNCFTSETSSSLWSNLSRETDIRLNLYSSIQLINIKMRSFRSFTTVNGLKSLKEYCFCLIRFWDQSRWLEVSTSWRTLLLDQTIEFQLGISVWNYWMWVCRESFDIDCYFARCSGYFQAMDTRHKRQCSTPSKFSAKFPVAILPLQSNNAWKFISP